MADREDGRQGSTRRVFLTDKKLSLYEDMRLIRQRGKHLAISIMEIWSEIPCHQGRVAIFELPHDVVPARCAAGRSWCSRWVLRALFQPQ